MPKLYVFALCEKVILDKDDKASLISLFNQIFAQILPNQKDVPRNAVANHDWWIFTSWKIEAGDVGKKFTQKFKISYPDGSQFGPVIETTFSPEEGKTHQQTTVNSKGFPIGQEGDYTIETWLEFESGVLFRANPIIVTVGYRKLSEYPPGFNRVSV